MWGGVDRGVVGCCVRKSELRVGLKKKHTRVNDMNKQVNLHIYSEIEKLEKQRILHVSAKRLELVNMTNQHSWTKQMSGSRFYPFLSL